MAKLGIDLDGVVYDFLTDFMTYAEETMGELPKLDKIRWNFFEDLGLSYSEFETICANGVDAGYIFRSGLPIKGSMDVLEKLKEEGHSIHVITHREFGEYSTLNTVEWLNSWSIPYDTITFAKDKTIVSVDLLIDDRPENVAASVAAGIDAVIFTQEWNEDYPFEPRVNSWKEFHKLVTTEYGAV